MKSTLLVSAIALLATLSSQAAVTFTGISQDTDGSVTGSPLGNQTGPRGSSQTLAGTAVATATPYTDFSFSVTLFAAAATPVPGSASATLQFTVADEPVNYSGVQADTFFDVGAGQPILTTSGVLAPGNYVLQTFANGATTSSSDTDFIGITIAAVPEPSTALLGLIGLAGLLRRRR